jgi:hypothetical protein
LEIGVDLVQVNSTVRKLLAIFLIILGFGIILGFFLYSRAKQPESPLFYFWASTPIWFPFMVLCSSGTAALLGFPSVARGEFITVGVSFVVFMMIIRAYYGNL